MSDLIVDYTLDSTTVANPDGSLPAVVAGSCAVVPGPGATALGTFPKALSLGTDGSIQTVLPPTAAHVDQICVRILFRPAAAVTAPQTLVDCALVPLSIRIEPGATAAELTAVVAAVDKTVGQDEASTRGRKSLSTSDWHVVDLVYDWNMLVVAVDGQALAVTAFPDHTLADGTGTELFIGTEKDGKSGRFEGAIAAIQLHSGIPSDVAAEIDFQRIKPEFYIRYKRNSLFGVALLGNPAGDIQWDPDIFAFVQIFDQGCIQFAPSWGVANVLVGPTWERYRDAATKSLLGYATSDEFAARAAGCTKTIFQYGAIYRNATGAVPVFDRIFHRYEDMGETASALGFPFDGTISVPGGSFQAFEHGALYHKLGRASAQAIPTEFLAAYRAAGGPGEMGFPLGFPHDVLKDGVSIGRVLDCDLGVLYSAPGGIFSLLRDIRTEYQARGGPLSDLGWPTASDRSLPGDPTCRYATFQKGTVFSIGGRAVAALPFQIYLGRLETDGSDNVGDDGSGNNDLYFNCKLTKNGTLVLDEHYPPGENQYPESNSADVEQLLWPVFDPSDPSLTIEIWLRVMDSDPISDDELGTYVQTLSLANAWGLKDDPDGLKDTGRFGLVRSFTWSLKFVPVAGAPVDFWGVKNASTPVITEAQYGAAFRNVDSDPEWYDPGDWINKAFYELAVKDVANGGNCFGMSLEAIYAWKGQSRLGLPLARFNDWNRVVGDINLKHEYQLGAEAIWWIVGQFVQGHTHDPVSVFWETMDCASRGDNAVLCLSQNSDFSGKPHCILPASWDTSKKPWTMKIYDPNYKNTQRDLFVDPDTNRFSYDGGNKYEGGDWDGGRLYYYPFSVLGTRPRTPDFEILMLLLAGVIILLGDAGESVSLKDPGGSDLDGSNGVPEQRADPKDLFFRFRGTYGDDPVRTALFFHCDAGRQATPPDPDHPAPPPAPPPPIRPISFVHKLRGAKDAPLTYSWKHLLSSVTITTPITTGEPLSVEADALGTDHPSVKVTTSAPKPVTARMGGRLAACGGSLWITIEPTTLTGTPLLLAERPGHGAVDVVGGAPGTLKVTVETVAGTKKIERTYDVPFTGSMRLTLLPANDYEKLQAGDIPTVRGPLQNSLIVTAK